MKFQVFLFMIFAISSCSRSASKPMKDIPKAEDSSVPLPAKEGEMEKFVMGFYQKYVDVYKEIDRNSLKEIRNKFSSECLLKDIEKSKLDFDPYISAQDCDSTLLETINFAFIGNGVVNISYGVGNDSRIIQLKLIHNHNKWLIDGLRVSQDSQLGCW